MKRILLITCLLVTYILADGYQQNSIFSQLSNTNLNFDPKNVQVMKGHFIEVGFQFSIYE